MFQGFFFCGIRSVNFKMQKYAAMLMFQFRFDMSGQKPRRRVCEKRIINFQ